MISDLRARAKAFLEQGVSDNWRPMMDVNSWLTFQIRQREDGKVDKVPVRANGRDCNVNDPRNHTSLNNAIYYVKNYPDLHHGIGFVFAGEHDFVGIDVDFYKLAQLTPLAQQAIGYILQFPTLTQRSLSGKGFHLFGRLNHPVTMQRLGAARQGLLGAVEVYSTTRFFAMTFNTVQEKDLPIKDAAPLINYILDRHLENGGQLPEQGGASLSRSPLVTENLELVIKAIRHMYSLRDDPCREFLFPLKSDEGNAHSKAQLAEAKGKLLARYGNDQSKVDMSLARTVAQKTDNFAHFEIIMVRNGFWPRPGKSARYLESTFHKAVGAFEQRREG
ncbi:hypothetical protein DPM33_23600 [Mesorhizobium hawassense]|uniref:Primase C-terminal 1 domain-containing protein n=1 Tax=Mesorhizobium hawassense TaxID=1209954 RepID=A0A330HJT8_9HYPH|nr:hypothetical protein [Mesorhizobium hawassense]RAZ88513.1 hypothetical protein DPM33_23600 [Mesorhizobium hawassense]